MGARHPARRPARHPARLASVPAARALVAGCVVLGTLLVAGTGPAAARAPDPGRSGAKGLPADPGTSRERAREASARVDRFTAEYRRHSAAEAAAAVGLTVAYSRVAEADDRASASGARLALARSARSGRVLGIYAYGPAARPELALLTADTAEDGLWQLAVGVPLTERLLAASARTEDDARATTVTSDDAADDAASAAAVLARALRTLAEERAAARQSLDAARAEVRRLEAQARREEAVAAEASAAAARLAEASSQVFAAGLATRTPVTAIGIPAEFDRAYRAAATTCPGLDWTLLAAVGQIESGHGRNNGPSSAGAIGPMQFMPGTFAAYGVDGDGDGRADAWDPQDAVFSAARYLCASGAGTGAAGVKKALFAYNHAQWYVDLVLAAESAIRTRSAR